MSLSRLFSGIANFFGYVPTIDLAAPGESALPVRQSTRALFNGAADVYPVYHVDGASLKERGRYRAHKGLVIIEGNVPDEARITVDKGRLVVTGNVGALAELSARVPEKFHTQTTLMPISNGKSVTLMPLTHLIYAGYIHKEDTASALTIGGDVGRQASLTSNHGIDIGGDIGGDVRMRHIRNDAHAVVHTGEKAAAAVKAALAP